ncbi:Major facilitator superfamily transporter [Apiospora aurea]|uniref:Major facilitator superfamily transporter n=1 Tax=Apiospora aurea TaxID=335848 RepID=A0ABR1QE57_9PEZI
MNSKEHKPPGIVCIDPTLHAPGAHSKVHHPGLVSGADFCDQGTEVERESPIRTPGTQRSLSPPQIITGRVFRTLTGGDICEAEVDVSEHFYQHHSAMTKVRPATQPILQEEAHSGHGGISKVRPADGVDTRAFTRQSESLYDPHSSSPYSNEPYSHQGHHPVSKPEELTAHTPRRFSTDATPPASSSLPGHPVLKEEESSKVASYWGDIPLGIENKETQDATKEPSGNSGEAPLEGSRPVDVDNSKPPWLTANSTSEMPHSTHESQPGSSTRSFSVHASQKRPETQHLLTQRRRSTSYASRGLETINQENKPNQQAQPFLPEGRDPRRATQWLRELLKYKKSNQPQLTQLPEKLHPRHEKHSHQSSLDASGKEVLTSVTTFSDKNAADADAINNAMTNLEQLLSEALHIANNVTEPSEHCHADDGEHNTRHWYARKDMISDMSRPASAHESLLGDLSEDDEHSPGFYAPSTVFIGAVEGLAHGCEALPLRSIERKGLAPLEFPWTNPILPMPPSDNQLKRDSVYPTPRAYVEDNPRIISKPRTKEDVPNSREVREYIRVFHQPPVTSRGSSKSLRRLAKSPGSPHKYQNRSTESRQIEADACSLDGGASDDKVDFGMPLPQRNAVKRSGTDVSPPDHLHHNSAANPTRASLRQSAAKRAHELRNISLRGKSHVSIRDAHFSLTKSHKMQPIARDWSPIRILIGIYAGLVPSIQYFIVDTNHSAILGNVGLYLGMALPTFFCWPLPLLHGRKPYILTSLAVAMPLLFPQALAISSVRINFTNLWTMTLLLSRALMGVALGFASMNFHSILTDLYGVSLMSRNPHGELVDSSDVRRHGGGLGVWLGIWTWCFIGSLGLGFFIGALVINSLQPSWGIYISIILIASVLILNVLTPEVRRSVWRRSVAEVKVGDQVSRRVARGEIMMHRVKDGPKWWGQEVYHGIALSLEMLRQPGFATMAVYLAWIYAQIVLIIVLLGSLTSRYYRLHSPLVGAAVSSVAIGALIAVPFQKANVFSRARYNPVATNSMTITSSFAWTSHLVRRAVFILVLPIAGAMYAVFSLKSVEKRTNYSSFPRVTAGYAVIHTFAFIFAAGATGIGGLARRNLGQRATTGVVAAILFVLTLLLISVLIRFRHVQIIPDSRTAEMEKWTEARRDSLLRRESAIAAARASGRKDLSAIPEEDVGWRPLVIGNPLDKNRRMNILELGALTRWSEIRKKNRLIDQGTHLNRQALEAARTELGHRGMEVYGDLQRSGAMVGELVRKVSKRSLRSKRIDTSSDEEGEKKYRAGNTGPVGAGFGHSHAAYPTELFTERECVMGQVVAEEGEESSSIDEPPMDVYVRSRSQDHRSHQMPKVQPHAGFEQQEVQGGPYHPSADGEPETEGGRRGHGAHMESKVRLAGDGQ